MDEADRAQAAEERDRALALQAHRAARPPNDACSPGGHCIDCEAPIEPARLAVLPHTARCAACAHQHEERARKWLWTR